MSDPSMNAATAMVDVSQFMSMAEGVIDDQFGAGFAEKHPGLVAGYVQACAAVCHGERIADGFESLAEAVRDVEAAIRESQDSMLIEHLAGIREGLGAIARTIDEAGAR